jgi:hypothetical protein
MPELAVWGFAAEQSGGNLLSLGENFNSIHNLTANSAHNLLGWGNAKKSENALTWENALFPHFHQPTADSSKF